MVARHLRKRMFPVQRASPPGYSGRGVPLSAMIQDNQVKSKRKALRFRCRKEPITYRTAYEEGEALLKNISTDGCALEWATNPPELDERVLLRIELEGEA